MPVLNYAAVVLKMIDSHCHLADKLFAKDRAAVIDRAHAAGVEIMIAIADSFPEAEECQKIATSEQKIFWTAGVHPHVASGWTPQSGQRLSEFCASPKCVAVGEIGLDYHYMRTPKDRQIEVFREQLTIAKELNKPAVVHCRDAVSDIREIMKEIDPPIVVIHCCTERWEDVAAIVAVGHYLSFTGIATYAKSDAIRQTIAKCPLEKMMIETDSPYLAPVPHRGKRNEPAFVVEVAKCIAQVKGISLDDVDRVTTANALQFFRLR